MCGSNRFSVDSLRKAVDDVVLRGGNFVTRWNKLIPTKVRIFSWKARPDRLPTRENLLKRGVILDDARCVLCDETIESGDHVFAGCRKSAEVRTEVNKNNVLLPNSLNNLEELFNWIGDITQSTEE